MIAATRKMSAEAFEEFAASNAGRFELVRGEVRELSPTGLEHGDLTNRLAFHLSGFVYEHDLGRVYTGVTGFRLDDGGEPTVRAPDIAFVAAERVRQTPRFGDVAPDLVVEVISPSDRLSDVAEKVAWWLRHGVRLVWVVDPANATVTAYHPDGTARVLQKTEALDGGDPLPGFALPLAELFR